MKHYQKHIYQILAVTGLILVSYVTAQAGTWNTPGQNPPSGNVDSPIHTGSTAQTKTGPFTVNSNLTTNGAFSASGAATLSSTLNTTGAATFGSTLTTTGAATFNNLLTVNGVASFNAGAALNGPTTIAGSNSGLRIYDRTKSTDSWQWYSMANAGTSWIRLWDHQNARDAMWFNGNGLGVYGGVWTGTLNAATLQLTGGAPAVGKVLMATDSLGTVAWSDPASSGSTQPPGVYKFNATYNTLMNNSEFRTWFVAQPNGAATIRPAGTGYQNNYGFSITQNTANKLCQFFTDGGAISFNWKWLGSDNGNNFLVWDAVQNKWRVNYSSWNDSQDFTDVTCFSMKGIVRGASLLSSSQENIQYSGSDTGVRDTY